jgi:hypothetical protein
MARGDRELSRGKQGEQTASRHQPEMDPDTSCSFTLFSRQRYSGCVSPLRNGSTHVGSMLGEPPCFQGALVGALNCHNFRRLTSSMQAMSGPSIEPSAPSEKSPSPEQPRHELPTEEPPMHFAPAPPISKAPTFTLPPPGSGAWQSVELPPPPSPMQQSASSQSKTVRQPAAAATPTRVTRSSAAAKRPEQDIITNPFQSRGPRKDHGVV